MPRVTRAAKAPGSPFWRPLVATACALGMLGVAVAAQGAAAGSSLRPPGGPDGSAIRARVATAPAALATSRPAAPLTVRPPTLRAEAAILIDLDTGAELYAKRPTDRRPIAS